MSIKEDTQEALRFILVQGEIKNTFVKEIAEMVIKENKDDNPN